VAEKLTCRESTKIDQNRLKTEPKQENFEDESTKMNRQNMKFK